MKQVIFFLFLFLPVPLLGGEPAGTFNAALSMLPIQYKNRIRPFESFAVEAVTFVTGQTEFEGVPPTRLVWQWMTDYEKWYAMPLIPVDDKVLRAELDLDSGQTRASAKTIFETPAFVAKAKRLARASRHGELQNALEKERLTVYQRALLFRDIVVGRVPGWIPHPERTQAPWLPMVIFGSPEQMEAMAAFYPRKKLSAVSEALNRLFRAVRDGPASREAIDAAFEFAESFQALLKSRDISVDEDALESEISILKYLTKAHG